MMQKGPPHRIETSTCCNFCGQSTVTVVGTDHLVAQIFRKMSFVIADNGVDITDGNHAEDSCELLDCATTLSPQLCKG